MSRRLWLLLIALLGAGAYAGHESRRRRLGRRPVPVSVEPVRPEEDAAVAEVAELPVERRWHGRSRRFWVLVAALVVACACAAGALAYWTSGSSTGGNGRGDIGTLGTGATPSASLVGRTATVSWSQTVIGGSRLGSLASGGYTVRRYAASAPSTPITPGASCSGSITGAADPLSCSESSLTTGRWLYTVTPTYYLWTGAESPQSTFVAVVPDAPTSVTLTNGGGTGNAFVNAANASSLSFSVVLPATSLASDTVHLSVSDGSTTVNATTQAGIAGGGTRSFTGVNASTLVDGTLTVSAWSTSTYGDDGAKTSITPTKDTVKPALSTMVTGDTGGTAGKLDTVTVTFSEPLAAYSAGTTPWTVASVPSGGTLSSVAVAGSTATLKFAEGGGAIDTTVGSFTIALATNAAGIRDPAGNLSTFAATPPTDGIAPVRTAMVMQDVNGNGKVDQVQVTFSEALASSSNTAQWSLASVPSAGSLTSVSTAGAVATLTIAEGAGAPDTAVNSFTLALAANSGGIRDAANNASSFAAAAPADGAKPALVSMTMLDVNANGKVDRVTAVFSEPLSAYTAANTPWTLAGVPSAGSLGSVAVATATATLTLNEGAGAADTSVGSFTIALATNANGIRDAAGNLSSFTARAPLDGAAPVRTAMVMQDVNANGKVDQVSVTFSETLANSTDASVWTLANVPSGGTLATVSTSGPTATVAITEGAGAANTAVGSMTVALVTGAGGIRDASNNLSSFAAAAPADGAKPVLVSMTMQDTNTNGRVDHVAAVFSETLATPYSAGNGVWTLANTPSAGAIASVAVATTTATLTITEGAGAADTAVNSFTVALATSGTGIRDAANNLSSFGATAPADGAAPVRTAMVMQDVNANGKVDQVSVTFSENLASSTATAPWTLANVPSGGTLAAVSTSGAVATLAIGEGAGAASTAVGTMTVALATGGIQDAAGNQSSFAATAPTDGAKPVLLTLTMLDNNTNGKVDRVTALFSELLQNSTATAPWTLANFPTTGTTLASVTTGGTATATLTLTEGGGTQNTAVGGFTVALATSGTGIRDAAGNLSSFAATSPLDGAAPVPVSIATTVPGANAGLMQVGDAIAITFSESILASSVPGTTSITETDPTAGNDTITITSLTNGARNLGGNGYINTNNTSAAFLASTLGVAGATVTATVAGSCTGTCGANITAGTGAFAYAPAASITDAAGNAAAGALTTAGTFRVF
ncbi:MAG TPA: hypothetical protein VMT59_14370 [Gaiellaceae bacterium]|nr:hypothetical protein [Gaiellaceae bacterium]